MDKSISSAASLTFEQECEIIETTLTESGASLERVRDFEKWRGKTYNGEQLTSFKHFCKSIEITYSTAWRRIEAGKVAKMISGVKSVNDAMNLRKVAMPQRRQLPANGSERGQGRFDDSSHETHASGQPEGKSAPRLPKDATGIEIPPDIQPFWNRNEEVQFLMGMVSKIRVTLEKADQSRDKLYCKIDRQGCISRLKQIYEEIESAKSYALCPDCNGIFTDGCQTCAGRGTLSKFYWGLLPQEIRGLREGQE